MNQVTLTLTLDIVVRHIFSHKSLNIASNMSCKNSAYSAFQRSRSRSPGSCDLLTLDSVY